MSKSPGRQSRAARAKLILASVIVTLGLLELGVRVYYGLGGAPTAVNFGSTSDVWKQRWLTRHRQSGQEVNYGFDRYDPQLGWSTKPNLRAYQFEGLPPVTTNAQGWRALRDYSYERRPGTKRIVALGDSFTFGEQARDEDVWTVLLEQQLDETEVFNLGVHGYGTDQQLLVLEEEGMKYQPDVVVLGFFVEDIVRNGVAFRDYAKPMFVLRDGQLVLTNSPVPSPRELLAEADSPRPWSYLLDFVRSRLAGKLETVNLDDIVEEKGLFELTRAIMQRMQDVTTAGGAKLLVVVIPSRRSMPGVEATLQQWAGEIGYAVVNAGPALEAAEKAYRKPMYNGFYHSTLGDVVMATTVRQALVKLGWVAPPSAETLVKLEARLQAVIAASPSN